MHYRCQDKKVHCFGLSVTLLPEVNEKEDTRHASLQVFGDKTDLDKKV
jgi:hypothetical protein